MDSYLDIANSPGMWIACSGVIFVVFFQVFKLTRIAIRAGREIGMSNKDMAMAFRSGFTVTIVPAIAVLLGLALLIPRLGLPFPWMRLSVIGSVAYELIVAGIAAAEMGLEGISSDFTAEVFTVAVWTMSLGAAIGLLIIAFLTPHIDKLKTKVTGGDQQWMQILSAATFFGAVSYMAAQPLVKGGSGLVAFLGGFVSVALIGIVITVGRQNWLKEWALSLSIVLGMVSAGVGFHFFGIGG